MKICLDDHIITIETVIWLIICSVPVTIFKLPTALKESLYKSKFMHRQTLHNRILYRFSSDIMSVLADIPLQIQDRTLSLMLLLLYVSKLYLDGFLNGSYHVLAEAQHFMIIIMILLLLISSNTGYSVPSPNFADTALQLLTTTMPYWAVNSIFNIYCTLNTLAIKDDMSLLINTLLMVVIVLLPLYLLCRKNFLLTQLVNNNITTNVNTKNSGGGKLQIFGVWLFIQIRWTVQQFIAIFSMTNVEAMLCPDSMIIITNQLPAIPSYRTHLSLLILSIGFIVSKIYYCIATDIYKYYDSKKSIVKSNINKTT